MRPSDLDFAAAAACFEGVRYRPFGRTAAVGIDCYGILHAPAAAVGVPLPDVRDYDPRMPDPERILRECRAHLQEVAIDDAGPGRVGVCRWLGDPHPRHFVVMLPALQIVHVDATYRRVTRVPAGWLASKLVTVFRLPGLDYGPPWSPLPSL